MKHLKWRINHFLESVNNHLHALFHPGFAEQVIDNYYPFAVCDNPFIPTEKLIIWGPCSPSSLKLDQEPTEEDKELLDLYLQRLIIEVYEDACNRED